MWCFCNGVTIARALAHRQMRTDYDRFGNSANRLCAFNIIDKLTFYLLFLCVIRNVCEKCSFYFLMRCTFGSSHMKYERTATHATYIYVINHTFDWFGQHLITACDSMNIIFYNCLSNTNERNAQKHRLKYVSDVSSVLKY